MKAFFDKNESNAIRRLFKALGVDESRYSSTTTSGELVILIKPSAVVAYAMDMIAMASKYPRFLVEAKVSKYQESWDKHFPPSAFQKLKR